MNLDFLTDDKPHDECGVVGVYAHQGAKWRGWPFLACTPCSIAGKKAPASPPATAVSPTFTKAWASSPRSSTKTTCARSTGHLAIGQNRYSTTGSSNLRNAQPYLIETIYGPLGVAHNGNLTNALSPCAKCCWSAASASPPPPTAK
jgi:amidophosphoribosyltransferase